ncbi:MAG TPA: tRNA-dihydrouridine synthase family protein [Fimbriimonadaceae bacterium]|nr:tRNA-dihydrouridine synthase family protein [Fimbriimonadaceae bacterium]
MLKADSPALVLAPMDGITDAPMRALQGATGAFSFGVSEFVRVSVEVLPAKVFRREVPELRHGGVTPTGMPVQVQILGGHPERMAQTALVACRAGAKAIDINFGCPAPTVNRNDGGASLLLHPCRIREVVEAVRSAVPAQIPVSAKLRLGWDCPDAIYENAAMAAEGGADWLTIHARTRVQGYAPPVFWAPIRRVRESLGVPVVANGDIWTMDDFRRCRDETGCIHFMLGRGGLADPSLPYRIARELGLDAPEPPETDWPRLLVALVEWVRFYESEVPKWTVKRLKQWLNIADKHGAFDRFEAVKRVDSLEELLAGVS